jgi:MipA family protein
VPVQTSVIRSALAGLAAVLLLPAVPAVAQDAPGVSFTLRGGIAAQPRYFGSDDFRLGPDLNLRLDHLRLGGLTIGTPDAQPLDPGFRLRGSFRYVPARKASRDPEFTGLNDIDTTLEVGLGASYTTDNWRLFGDLRYGAFGHEGLVADLGGDVIFRPSDDLTLTLGPRAQYGDGRFVRTYFGVPTATANFPVTYAPSGGLVSTGAEAGFSYRLDDRWSIEGAARYDRLRSDAARSPITQQGSRDQFSVRLGVARQIQFGF